MMRTGMRCVTLTKLPVAFEAGTKLNVFCEAGAIADTRPWNVIPLYASTLMSTGRPTRTFPSCVSL